MKTLAIVGCRDAPVKETMDLLLDFDWEEWNFDQLVTGDAKGVDTAVVALAREWRIPCKIHKADWEKNVLSAGPIRNQLIVDDCDELLAIWDGESRGTLDSIKKAIKAGKRVTILPVPKRKEKEIE